MKWAISEENPFGHFYIQIIELKFVPQKVQAYESLQNDTAKGEISCKWEYVYV